MLRSQLLNKLPSTINTYTVLMKAPFILLFIILSSIIPVEQAQSAATGSVYYVSPNGNDSNLGTLNAPWRTIGHAVDNNVIKPGDLVYIRAGTYQEYIKPEIPGAPGNPITYRNYPGETPVITGSNYRYWRLHILDVSHLHFEGLTFDGFVGGAIQVRANDKDVTDIQIIGNTFRNQTPKPDSSSKTITVTPYTSGRVLSKIVIQDNQFFNMDTYKAPVIQFDGEVVDSKITGNTLQNSTSIGIGIAGRPSKGQPHNILVKGNDISGHGSPEEHVAGIYLDGAGTNIVVEENIVHDGLQGIKVGLEPDAATLTTRYVIVRRNVIYNNEQINMNIGSGAICSQSGSLEDSVIVHNTIYSNINNIANGSFNCGENIYWENNIFVHDGLKDGLQYRLLDADVDTTTWKLDHNLFLNQSSEKEPYKWLGERYDSLSEFQSLSGQDMNSQEGLPRFNDVSNYNFSLTANSAARDRGGYLTLTTSGGNGTTIPVGEAWYFSDGLGWQAGDMVQIGNNAPVMVMSVDTQNNRITVNQSISWEANDAVSYAYANNAPDMGAFEFAPALTVFGIPKDRAITVRWQVNEELPVNTVWKIEYTGIEGNQQSPINAISGNVREYDLTGLTNYTFYDIKVSAIQDNEVVLSQTIRVMPTDMFTFLPLVSK